jgi:hypothetical protein
MDRRAVVSRRAICGFVEVRAATDLSGEGINEYDKLEHDGHVHGDKRDDELPGNQMEIIGAMAVDFSNLEYYTSLLLEVLMGEGDVIAAGIVTEDLPWRKKLDLLRRLAVLRFSGDATYEQRVVSFVKQARMADR